jgi:hypothetical protein
MKIAKGETIETPSGEGIITKVSRMPQMIKRGNKFFPTMRIYYKQGKKQGHYDCEVSQDIEVIFNK